MALWFPSSRNEVIGAFNMTIANIVSASRLSEVLSIRFIPTAVKEHLESP